MNYYVEKRVQLLGCLSINKYIKVKLSLHKVVEAYRRVSC
jgi:hypothetical protein